LKKFKPNREVLKFLNDGKFDSKVCVMFESMLKDEGRCPFKFEHKEFTVEKNTVFEFEFWSLPQELGVFKDRMIVLADNNPSP